MGDIVSLVERAAENITQADAMKLAEKMQKGQFDLADLKDQLQSMMKMGGIASLMNMMPGMAQMKDKVGNISDKALIHQVALIDSMTVWERKHPRDIDGKRKRRIALGAGLKVEDVNKLLKSHRNMADMMKQMKGKNAGRGGMFGGLSNMLGMGGGAPDPEMMKQLEAMQKNQGKLPDKMPELAPSKPTFSLPGLGSLKSPFPPNFPFGGKK
jgi:signal recognition particle subunit SRP54